jgi:uncharacterized membrane protein
MAGVSDPPNGSWDRETQGPNRPERTEEPWIETRRGGLFFINALFIFPHVMVLVPLLTRIFIRARGGVQEESTILDTFPLLAEHMLPWMGWILVLPIGLVLMNLREETAPLPRAGLMIFLVLHLAALTWTVATWLGLTGGTLPGGWS